MKDRLGKFCVVHGLAAVLGAAGPEVRRAPHPESESAQVFARGLDLTPGTDFALEVGGIPLNVPSHIHGPGFLSQGILVPELLEGPLVLRGPYGVEQGACAVAGSATREPVAGLDQPFLAATWGGAATDRYGRVLWADRSRERHLVYALEFMRNERPWGDLMGSARFNGLLRRDGVGLGGRWTFTALASEDKRDGGAALPLRPSPANSPGTLADARAGDGVWNQRLLLGWRLTREGPGGFSSRLRLHGGAHHERAWHNWTFYLRDPLHGDQAEQLDRRVFLGGDWVGTWESRGGRGVWIHTLGVEGRADHITAAEVHPTVNRERLGAEAALPRLGAWGDLVHGALLARSAWRWAPEWEAFLGLRLDGQWNRVVATAGPWSPQHRGLLLGSPRCGLSFTPVEGTTFSLAAGQAFRPGDAFREAQPLVRARSAEFTVRTRPLEAWTTGLTLYRLELESEALFDPAQDAFTGRGPTLHRGLELRQEFRQGPWRAELGVAWNRARFREGPPGARQVPGSVPRATLASLEWKAGGMSVKGTFQHGGPRPLVPEGSAMAGAQEELGLTVARSRGPWTLALEVRNALSRKTFNEEYRYASRFPGEAPEGVEDRHLKRAKPQTLRVSLRRRF